MRAVALSDPRVQEKIAKSFIPLKVVMPLRTKAFPLDWPALLGWKIAFALDGGEKCEGFTGCSIVSPDLKAEYANTGSAFVWELFDSSAYDAQKFGAMLDVAEERWKRESAIRAESVLSDMEREKKLAAYRDEVRSAVGKEGFPRLPPKGFTIQGGIELFELSGDIPKK